MRNSYGYGIVRWASAGALGLALLAGCESAQEKAIDAAKKQAAATGQAQQVVSVDKSGNTTTTTVQPPAAGQTAQVVTTTTTPAAPGAATASTSGPANASGAPAPAPAPVAAAEPGGAPVIRPADVNIPAGSELVIRVNQRISSRTTPPGSRFDGELDEGWTDGHGRVILPRGTHVEGRVVESHNGGNFKGASVLGLRLTSLTLNGTRYPLETRAAIRERKGKGKRTAGFIGGGGGLGLLIGGLAGGGKGALIGGLAGAGAGTVAGASTDNHGVDIPAESIVHFRLADDLTLQE